MEKLTICCQETYLKYPPTKLSDVKRQVFITAENLASKRGKVQLKLKVKSRPGPSVRRRSIPPPPNSGCSGTCKRSWTI